MHTVNTLETILTQEIDLLHRCEELKPWIEKVSQIKRQTKVLRIYFNNHYGGKAVVNALEFKEMIGMPSSEKQRKVLEKAKHYLSKQHS